MYALTNGWYPENPSIGAISFRVSITFSGMRKLIEVITRGIRIRSHIRSLAVFIDFPLSFGRLTGRNDANQLFFPLNMDDIQQVPGSFHADHRGPQLLIVRRIDILRQIVKERLTGSLELYAVFARSSIDFRPSQTNNCPR
jgi:hypothetical protein